jgi:hypothetical protein
MVTEIRTAEIPDAVHMQSLPRPYENARKNLFGCI